MIKTALLQMDYGIHEQVFLRPWGYLVVLNSRDSYEMQRMSYEHAIDHILNNDWQKESVQQIELDAHR